MQKVTRGAVMGAVGTENQRQTDRSQNVRGDKDKYWRVSPMCNLENRFGAREQFGGCRGRGEGIGEGG